MYSQTFTLQAKIIKAMAEPKRLELIHLLRGQALNVTDMQQMLGLNQANISQHLMVLREAGVVSTQRNGKEIAYSLADPKIIQAVDLIRDLLIKRHQGDPLADELTLKMSELVPVVKDPICGMRLSPKTAAYAFKHQDQTYYFCAEGCLNKFKAKKI